MAQKSAISPKVLEEVTRTAIQTAMDYLEKEKQKQQKVKRDWRLRNTKLLLRNYRSFKLHCEGELRKEIERLKDPDLLAELDTDEFAVGSVLRSKRKTVAMMKYIDQMLEVYRIICETSGKDEDIRKYRTIYLMYVAEDKKTAEEIAEGHNIDKRTVYKDLNKACEALSTLIFGVDGIRMID